MKKKINGKRKDHVLANQVHVDTLLGNISVKYKPEGLINYDVAPKVPVKKTSDLFRVYERNFRIPETRRANRAESREHFFDVSTATYNLQRHSLKSPVSDTDAENYDLADLRSETTEELTEKIEMRKELDTANLMTSTNWSLNVSLAAGGQFSDNTTTSNPIPVFQTGSSTVIANSGKMPNFGILPRDAKVSCVNHVSILDRVKYTSAEVDEAKLAALFEVKQLLVPSAAYDTAALGATTSLSNFWGDHAFLGYKPDSPGPLKVSSMYCFEKGMPLVKRWRDEARESEIIEVNKEYQVRVVASLTGYLIKDTRA